MKIAVLGTGSIGTRHLDVLKKLSIPSVAVPIRRGKADELLRSGQECAHSLEEAKAMGALAVVIATETGRHTADTDLALRLGLHTLCEKPLSFSVDSARHLLPLSAEKGLHLCVACCMRFNEGLQVFRARLPEIGTIHSARIECRSYLPDWHPGRDYRQSYSARKGDGGVLLDLIHEIDYALWMFGRPQAVSGMTANTSTLGIDAEELAEAHWSAPSAVAVSLGVDYLTRPTARYISANGQVGSLTYDFMKQTLQLLRPNRPAEECTFTGVRQDMFLRQMQEFIAVLNGAAPRILASAREGLDAVAVVEAWKRGNTSGRQEEVIR
jgi:predicted dehydrogenase